MSIYITKTPIRYNGKTYILGEEIKLEDEDAKELINLGAINKAYVCLPYSSMKAGEQIEYIKDVNDLYKLEELLIDSKSTVKTVIEAKIKLIREGK